MTRVDALYQQLNLVLEELRLTFVKLDRLNEL